MIRKTLPLALLLAACGNSQSDSTSLQLDCPDSPAPDLHEAAVCVCEDFGDVGALLVGSGVPGDKAIVGVNGSTGFVNAAEIRGDLIAYGGIKSVSALNITGGLSSAADADVVGSFDVGGDMEIGGDVRGIGRLDVDGTLRVGGEFSFLGLSSIGDRQDYGTTPDPPCGCDPATFFDVGAAVADAAADNDNAAAGLSTELSNIGVRDIRLSTGRYYFSDADQIGLSRITIDGSVALYIDGSINSVGAEVIDILPGSTLDLFVSGSVRTVGAMRLGSELEPGAFNLYIGGAEPLTVSVGLQIFNATIYAPQVDLHYVGATKIRGAVFANRILGVGLLTVGYAAPSVPPDLCQPPDDGGDPPDDSDDPDPDDPPGEDDPPLVL